MPVYEYQCVKCGKVSEAIRAMRDADAPLPCEHCGAKTKRKHSVFAAATSKPHDVPPGPGGCGPGCGCHMH